MSNNLPKIEFEGKYKISNVEVIKNSLLELKACWVKAIHNEDVYFKIPQKIERTKYLRIRRKDNHASGTLAYHEVINDFKTNEWETAVDNASMSKVILEKLGFSVEVTVVKKREIFMFEDCEIVLDEVKKLGFYIEIEAPDKAKFEHVVKQLALNEKDRVSGAGYPDLLKNQSNKDA